MGGVGSLSAGGNPGKLPNVLNVLVIDRRWLAFRRCEVDRKIVESWFSEIARRRISSFLDGMAAPCGS